jgi:hypothetical protein
MKTNLLVFEANLLLMALVFSVMPVSAQDVKDFEYGLNQAGDGVVIKIVGRSSALGLRENAVGLRPLYVFSPPHFCGCWNASQTVALFWLECQIKY